MLLLCAEDLRFVISSIGEAFQGSAATTELDFNEFWSLTFV